MNNNTLSIDWEDFGQLYTQYHFNIITPPINQAIERQTMIILDMLDETQTKTTFFVLGMLAKYKPELVKKIFEKGHEIALHGQNHKPMFQLSYKESRNDIEESYKIVTDIIGKEIVGYRAPFFSINESNLYVLEILSELGFLYDSSIFPKKMPRYGIKDFPEENGLYDLPDGSQLVELPLSIANYFGKIWPVAGGGYIRLMPRNLVKKVFKDFRKINRDAMIYMHPYEFDNFPLDITTNYPIGASYSKIKTFTLNLRWNLFRNSVKGKIEDLLNEYSFITCQQKALYVKEKGNSTKLLGCTK